MYYIESEQSKLNMLKRSKSIRVVHLTPNEKKTKLQLFKTIIYETWSTIIKSGFSKLIFKTKCRLKKELIYDNIAKFDPEDNSEIDYICKTDFTGMRIVVYTAIFGNYDCIKEPLYISPNCDYVIFTDLDVPPKSVWKKIETSQYNEIKDLDAYHKSKFFKLHPHLFLKDYDFSVWVDGSTTIVADLIPLIDRMRPNTIAMFKHPWHNCIYTEANWVRYTNSSPTKIVKRQIKKYKKEGMPNHFGVMEATIIIRKHNESLCAKIMEDWWEEVSNYSMRDQISFPYVIWKNGLDMSFVYSLGANRQFNPRFFFSDHNKQIKFFH